MTIFKTLLGTIDVRKTCLNCTPMEVSIFQGYQKVENPYFVYLILLGHLYMSGVGSDSKNGYQKDTCQKKVGVSTQIMITFVGSTSNKIEGTCITN
jgi:hypothetical protein